MKPIPFIQRKSLFYKISSLVLFSLILSIGVSTAFSIKEQTKTITNELIEKNKIISEQLASSIQSAFWSLNWLFVEKQMQTITKTRDVTFLKLIKPNEEIYLSSGEKSFVEFALPSILMNSDDQAVKEWINPKTSSTTSLIITPIKIGKDRWTLVAGLSMWVVEDAKKHILKNSIMWGGAIFMLGVFISFFLARDLIKPIQQLLEGTLEIGKGNLDYRINLQSHDEIGTLADSFNDMIEDLQKTTASRDQLMMEINERKQAEKALRESEFKYKSLFNNAQMGISRSTINDGTIVEANDTIARFFGFKNREHILASEFKARDFYVDPGTKEKVLATLNKNGEFNNFEARLYRTDNSIAWFRYSGIMYPEKDYIEIVATDITEEKKLQKKLLQAQKMEAIGTLAGGVAHDLNNLLSGLVSYPELLLMDIPEDSPLRKPILTIRDSGKKAAAIVEDLLTLARRGVAVTEVVNLNEVISDYLKSPEYEKLKFFYHDKKIEIKLCSDLLNIMGSTVHLSKTVMNLVSNAAEAIPGAGTIIISTSNRHIDRPFRGYQDVKEGDYVVLDMIMDPGMDGLDTYRKIIALRPGQKAILASGYSKTDRVKKAQEYGAGQYIKKPYTLEKIGMAVRAALDKQP